MSLGDLLLKAFPAPAGWLYVNCEDDARIEVEDLGTFWLGGEASRFECVFLPENGSYQEFCEVVDLPQTALRQVLNALDARLSAQVEQTRKARDTLI